MPQHLGTESFCVEVQCGALGVGAQVIYWKLTGPFLALPEAPPSMESRAPFADFVRSGVAFLGRAALGSTRKVPGLCRSTWVRGASAWELLRANSGDMPYPCAYDAPFAVPRSRWRVSFARGVWRFLQRNRATCRLKSNEFGLPHSSRRPTARGGSSTRYPPRSFLVEASAQKLSR